MSADRLATVDRVVMRGMTAGAYPGAAVVVVGERFGMPQAPVLATGAVLVFVLRFLAIRRGWRLPVAPDGGDNG